MPDVLPEQVGFVTAKKMTRWEKKEFCGIMAIKSAQAPGESPQ